MALVGSSSIVTHLCAQYLCLLLHSVGGSGGRCALARLLARAMLCIISTLLQLSQIFAQTSDRGFGSEQLLLLSSFDLSVLKVCLLQRVASRVCCLHSSFHRLMLLPIVCNKLCSLRRRFLQLRSGEQCSV